ncbi:TIGR00304 family membrane protein [Acidianus brierleyi]|uniref:DUF131 domain-containing protein n=1 Tax=Acidianus brierleyi TaxID=41673 RepID=A0A2U9IF44_9CREN|nr:DUF131 domain-containing protein [Acidianus brierleyi]AWR94564.1 DUF131 domain-containing protein [Acidianus brierleyi]
MRLTIIGFLIIFIGMLLIIFGSISQVTPQSTSSAIGGLVLIGPIPIFFGVGPHQALLPLVTLGIIFTIISIIFFILSIYMFRKNIENR